MPDVDINWLAILAAVVVNMVVGAFWYSPMAFGKEWSKLVGRKLEDMRKNAGPGYFFTTVGAFVQAYVLAHFVVYASVYYPTYSTATLGALTGLWAWVAFVAVTQGVNTVFSGGRKKLWAINTGYFLVVLVVNGIILASWK